VSNNQVLFVIGVVLLPIGSAKANPVLMGVGLIFFFLGLTNRIKGVRD
jgi:hypothetical protein